MKKGNQNKKTSEKSMIYWYLAIWVWFILMGILSVIYGCASDPNRESMEECHTYCCWHGLEYKHCN